MQALDASHFGFSQYLSCHGEHWNGSAMTPSVFTSSNYWLAAIKFFPYIFYSVTDTIHILSFSDLWSNTPSVSPNDVRIYPNPTTNLLNIERTDANPIQITVKDMLGNALNNYIMQQKTTIDVSYLPAGVYCLLLNDGKNVSAVRFVKK
jgi:hypothetical protein